MKMVDKKTQFGNLGEIDVSRWTATPQIDNRPKIDC